MHAYAALVLRRMDECGYKSRLELAKASGVSDTRIGEVVNDTRQTITRMPDLDTVRKLARALRISPDELLVAAAGAYGVPVSAPITVYSAKEIQDSELARELMSRAVAREAAGDLEVLDLSSMQRGAAQDIGRLRRSLIQEAAEDEAAGRPDLARAQRHLAAVLQDALERAGAIRGQDA